MYLLEFVNLVRAAQDAEPIDALPPDEDPGFTPLEIAMGARLEPGLMRFGSFGDAQSVAAASGLPLGIDGMSVALPAALAGAVPEHTEGRGAGFPISAEIEQDERGHRGSATG
jgi:hypothetical protein